MIEKLKPGQKLLVLRYGNQIIENCIEKHIEIIDKKGYCWFGKLGLIPSKKLMDAVFSEEIPMVILYSRQGAFLCEVEESTENKPKDGYPDYYKTELFDNYTYPSVYFKLKSINKIDMETVNDFTVISSGNKALDTLNNSMSSFIFVCYGERTEEMIKAHKKQDNNKREKLPENDCVYRKEMLCSLKSCVNYQYECDRPAFCSKQKR